MQCTPEDATNFLAANTLDVTQIPDGSPAQMAWLPDNAVFELVVARCAYDNICCHYHKCVLSILSLVSKMH